MNILEVKNLKIYFRAAEEPVKAVDGVSFEIEKNKVFGLVGESGSGKTLTALSILKLIPEGASIVDGSILFNPAHETRGGAGGADLLNMDRETLRRLRGAKISIVFQDPSAALNPVFTVGYQIAESVLAHRNVGKAKAREAALEYLNKVHIPDPIKIFHDYSHQLSGGTKQRIGIAMALVNSPELLILDEPTTALDVTIQASILDLLEEIIEKEKLSILFISHDFGIIARMCDEVGVMYKGKIVERGSVDKILQNPEEPYTVSLLESVKALMLRQGLSSILSETDRRIDMTIVRCDNLRKYFPIKRGYLREESGVVKAVDGVSLEIRKGGTFGLVGESGSGKTTLGKIILGILKPDSGTVRMSTNKPQVIFQDPYNSLDPKMRVRDIIAEGLLVSRLAGGPVSRLVEESLGLIGLPKTALDKFPHQFSGGERQRIAIARAIITRPEFIVCDEPVSSLDVTVQLQILKLLKDIQEAFGITYLFISHDLRVIRYMCDRVAVMKQGKIVEEGKTEDLYSKPAVSYTKLLLSSILEIKTS
ncbi:MAG: ABC transporter ATP-binding protein [Candidatus Omnitrophota bacterium]|nr:ABC transporter ATP-binding protein [Candidatus Omnitrophota bacterium]